MSTTTSDIAARYGERNRARIEDALAAGRQAAAELLGDVDQGAPTGKEESVQSRTITLLTRLGYTVLQTSVRYPLLTCPECHAHFRSQLGTGTTPGVPDLLISGPGYPPGVWLGVEVKGPRTPIRPAQRELAKVHKIIIARSPAEALAGVKLLELGILGQPGAVRIFAVIVDKLRRGLAALVKAGEVHAA